MWDSTRHFYFDLTLAGERVPVKTAGAYWTLLAGVATADRARLLTAELSNPETFGRPNSVPTLAANEPLYDRHGGYWRGAVWAPTTTMVIRGLERYGYDDLARDTALRYLDLVARVYRSTGTIWENYSPEEDAPGEPAKRDFVGWSGIGPIMYLLEYGVGLRSDASRNALTWHIGPAGQQGCEHFRFNGHELSLVATATTDTVGAFNVVVKSDGDFELIIDHSGRTEHLAIHKGQQEFELR
jgi:glycogen debranching enzyme